eukprot:g377.t1
MASKDKVEPSLPKVIGFIGIGTINSAVIRGLLSAEIPPTRVIISPRNAAKAALLKKDYPEVVEIARTNQDVVEAAPLIVIATPPKPEISEAILRPLQFRKEHTIVSLIAGIRADSLEKLCGPVKAIVQAFPLPPAQYHKSTTVVTPRNREIERMFGILGNVVPVDDFDQAMKMSVVSCIMGDFYRHQSAVYEWLCEQGISKDIATRSVGAFFETFNHASMSAHEEGMHGFAHLVAEQTPGGMNEQVIRELTKAGNYDALKRSMSNILDRMTKK